MKIIIKQQTGESKSPTTYRWVLVNLFQIQNIN